MKVVFFVFMCRRQFAYPQFIPGCFIGWQPLLENKNRKLDQETRKDTREISSLVTNAVVDLVLTKVGRIFPLHSFWTKFSEKGTWMTHSSSQLSCLFSRHFSFLLNAANLDTKKAKQRFEFQRSTALYFSGLFSSKLARIFAGAHCLQSLKWTLKE